MTLKLTTIHGKTYEETAYEAYGKVTDFKNFQGNPMPAFKDLPEKIQEAWKAAAQAIYDVTVEEIAEDSNL